MEHRPTNDPRILEALEACRPGSDDLHDPAMEPLVRQMELFPELHELFERLHRTDEAVAEAFGRVPVPTGLADRVLARLKAADMASRGMDITAGADVPTASVGMALRPRRWPRRAWLGVAGALAVAASVVIAVLLNHPRSSKFSAGEVLDKAIAFFNEDARLGGVLLTTGPLPPASYPLSPALPTRGCQISWRWVEGPLDSRSVAYDMIGPSGVSATVYVMPLRVADVGNYPPTVPMLATGRRSAAAWQEGERLYVMVVEGETREYERFFLDFGAGPVT